tara:strand:- start:13 stop:201 length:189 start_codon:yes stop_codon:yes gene_type:complete
MKIIVNGYTYETDEKAKVGDIAVVPTAQYLREFKGDTWQGEITSIESDYQGYCVKALKIIKK